MELNDNLSVSPKGLVAAQNYQQADNLGRQSVSQPVTTYSDQYEYRLGTSLSKLRSGRDIHRSWAASDISQGPREAGEIRGELKIFVETCQRWKLKLKDQVILLGYQSGDSIGMQILNGRVRAHSRDIKDRSGYVIAISIGLGILYGESIDAENQWLRNPRQILDGKSPLDYMLGGKMIDLITINRMVERERGL
ncbi:MAG: DUF2384 domain-containing protein [Albidovulum sp.]|nr:DUF2384 domain-containing protein [Albidovulum sp.]